MAEGTDPVLTAGPVTSVAEVIERLNGIRDAAGGRGPEPRSGMYWFSRLYLVITENVRAKIDGGRFFADNRYLAALDVAFANRYLDAVRAHTRGEPTPEVWRFLFDVPPNREILPIQLAMAGVNAHINLDLAFAVVGACRELGRPAIDHEGQRADYDKVNTIFAEEMERLLGELAGGAPRFDLLERMASEVVALARGAAWENAAYLWTLDPESGPWRDHEKIMDEVAATFGRALLVDLPG